MASHDILDLQSLLAPVSEEIPSGGDLRNDPELVNLYYAARDARAAAGRAERQATSSENPSDFDVVPPEWKTLSELAPDILATKSKHLEVAAWLTEALVRLHGFAGLRDGFRLMNGLVERFWDDLYPRPDSEGLEARVYPLTGLNGGDTDGTLVAAVRRVPLTSKGGYALWQYTRAQNLEGMPAEQRQALIADGAVSLEAFKTAALESGFEFYETLGEDVATCLEAFETMTQSIDSRCGADAPPSSRVKAVLTDVVTTIGAVGPKRPAPMDGDGEGGGEGGGVTKGKVGNREQAFATLLEVAAFFERTEPHSPLSFALKQAVRWGQMSLPELWGELINDKNKRQEVFRLIGVKERED